MIDPKSELAKELRLKGRGLIPMTDEQAKWVRARLKEWVITLPPNRVAAELRQLEELFQLTEVPEDRPHSGRQYVGVRLHSSEGKLDETFSPHMGSGVAQRVPGPTVEFADNMLDPSKAAKAKTASKNEKNETLINQAMANFRTCVKEPGLVKKIKGNAVITPSGSAMNDVRIEGDVNSDVAACIERKLRTLPLSGSGIINVPIRLETQ